jgi:putative ABC transport system permease protein
VTPQTQFAWAHVTHNKTRAAAGVSGVAFAIVLLFTQLGFYDTTYRSSTRIYDQLDFDVVLRSPQYGHLRAANTVPRRRLYQAAAVAGVASAAPLYVNNGVYQEPESGTHHEVIVLAIDPRTQPFALPEIANNVHRLTQDDAALMDRLTRTDYDPVRPGQMPTVDGRTLRTVGTYAYGAGFIGDATILVSDRTFARIYPRYPLSNVSLGLVKLAPGADRGTVIAALRTALPDDVQVLPREALEADEQNLFVNIRPIGIMFTSGVVLALCVGAVIIYQILSSDITDRLREYATLKAMGHDDRFIRAIVIRQGMIYAALGVLPALPLSLVLYAGLRAATNLPMVMTGMRIAFVTILALAMSIGAALFAIRKVANADPAELF